VNQQEHDIFWKRLGPSYRPFSKSTPQKKEIKMSWSITSKGRAADVAGEVAANPNVPQPIKDLVSIFAEGARSEQDGMEVITHGHHGGKGESIGSAELKITPIWLAPTFVPPQPKAPDEPKAESDPAPQAGA
jgi:hypothetical protein